MNATCEHCGAEVIEALFRGTGRLVLLDPQPHARGNLHLIELGSLVQFVPSEQRDPKSPRYVPPSERYQSHMVTCTAHCRPVPQTSHDNEGRTSDPECASDAPDLGSGKAPGSAVPVHQHSS